MWDRILFAPPPENEIASPLPSGNNTDLMYFVCVFLSPNVLYAFFKFLNVFWEEEG